MKDCKPEVGKHGKFQSCGCRVRKNGGPFGDPFGGPFGGVLHTSPGGLDDPWTRHVHEKEYDRNKR